MELDSCKSSKKTLIRKIRLEKEESLKNSNIKYTKGIWPLENYSYISSPYGYRKHPITKRVSFHNGIDIPAPKNTSVLASDDGIVVFAGYKNGYGNVVEIEHFDNCGLSQVLSILASSRLLSNPNRLILFRNSLYKVFTDSD